jgi:hypothetical protein
MLENLEKINLKDVAYWRNKISAEIKQKHRRNHGECYLGKKKNKLKEDGGKSTRNLRKLGSSIIMYMRL